jgi:hypothetical protein
MSNFNVTLDLKARKDRDGKTFYVTKIKGPILIDCRKGAVFLIFTSDQGEEQMQIALMDKNDQFDDLED